MDNMLFYASQHSSQKLENTMNEKEKQILRNREHNENTLIPLQQI